MNRLMEHAGFAQSLDITIKRCEQHDAEHAQNYQHRHHQAEAKSEFVTDTDVLPHGSSSCYFCERRRCLALLKRCDIRGSGANQHLSCAKLIRNVGHVLRNGTKWDAKSGGPLQ